MPAPVQKNVPPERLALNLARVRAELSAAAVQANRVPGTVRLVAVTKYVGAAEVGELLRLGVTEFGENRIQPAHLKIAALAGAVQQASAHWRMIGHLQTNKVRDALKDFSALDAVDSVRLLEAIAGEARKLGRGKIPCLAEVNVSGEAQKYGLKPDELEAFLRRAGELPEIDLQGLMCMAPYNDDAEKYSRPVFKGLRELFEHANAARWYSHPLTELSMGMSGDFHVAIAEGATLVRIGSALFE
jgi:hypothetical protein